MSENGATVEYLYVRGVKLHPDWGVIRALYPRPGKWHLGTYECEDSMCRRGGEKWGFEECEPLSSIDPAELCLACVGYVLRHNVKMDGDPEAENAD